MVDTPLQNPLDIRAGRRLAGRYRLERLIAHGGMASVWLATDEQLRRPVAVKLLHEHLRDPRSIERFRSEGKLAAQLSHPGVVAIYDTFHDGGVDGIVLEFVDGITLRDRLDTEAPPTPAETVEIARQVAVALADAHQRGLVHRDIKPANILLGPRREVKVTDFGIAKLLHGSDLTQPGTYVGTAKYLAPEQVTGEPVDGRADVYGLGVVLYEMLCGVAPFSGDTDAATALARLQLAAPPLRRHRSDLPEPLADLVDRMLERTPARRPTMAEAAAALAAAAPSAAAAPAPGNNARRRRRARGPLLVFLAVVVVALVVAAALVVRTDAGRNLLDDLGWRSSPPPTPVPIDLSAATISSYDPPPKGDESEHDDLLAFLHDGNPLSVWTTEKYSSAAFGGLKDGLGIVIDLGRATSVSELEVTGASTGWAATVYVVDGAPDELDSWGPAVGRRSDIAGAATFTFPAARGRTVLLWITDLGNAAQVRIGELELRGPA